MDAILYDEPKNNENDYTDLRPVSTNYRQYAELNKKPNNLQNDTHVPEYIEIRPDSENVMKYDDLNSGKSTISTKKHVNVKKLRMICIVSIVLTGIISLLVTFLALHCVSQRKDESVCDSLEDFDKISEYIPEIGADCPVGWLTDRSFCYKEFIDRKTWYQARDFCRTLGAELVSIMDKEESDFIDESFPNDFLHWIGLNKFQGGVNFTWSDGSSLNFTNWHPGEPNNFNNNEYCVQLFPNKPRRWNDNNCFISSRFVCKTQKMPNCGTGSWLFYNNSCYMFVRDEAVTWKKALSRCRNVSADLLIVNSKGENNFIISQTTKFELSNDIWIGLTDLDITNEYRWVDGSLPNIVNWGFNQPNNRSHNCAKIFAYYGTWDDAGCGDKNGFICEKKLF